MTAEPNNDIEELTAYLDGELDQTAVQKIEQRLGEDPNFLAEMQALQKTWDFLDQLPDVEPSASFTKTTMEIVIGDALQETRRNRNKTFTWLSRLALLIALPAILFAISFSIISKLKAEPNRYLVEKLSVIENYPRYQIIENDLEFLAELNRLNLFSKSPDGNSGIAGIIEPQKNKKIIPDQESDRIAFIESFDLEQKSTLEKKRDDFLALSEATQTEFEEFDNRIMSREDRDQLVSVMNAYVEWLKTIDSSQRSELLDITDKTKRIRAIHKIRDQQSIDSLATTGVARLPTREDDNCVFTWYTGVFQNNEDRIRKQFAVSAKRWAKENRYPLTDAAIRRSTKTEQLTNLVGYLMKMDPEFLADLAFSDQDLLYTMLSPEARTIMDNCTEPERKRLLLYWVASANQSKRNVDLDELDDFAKTTLSTKERSALDKMSTEKYYETLRKKYLENQNFDQAPTFGDFEDLQYFLEFQEE
ncbi:MAG: anti-sigma factor [Mariniblastus sp.]